MGKEQQFEFVETNIREKNEIKLSFTYKIYGSYSTKGFSLFLKVYRVNEHGVSM